MGPLRSQHRFRRFLAVGLVVLGTAVPSHVVRGQEGAHPAGDGGGLRAGRYRVKGEHLQSRLLADGDRLWILTGRAHFFGEDLDLTGELGRYYQQRAELEVVGSVLALSDSLTLRCDSLHVFEATEIGHAFGHVEIETADGVLGRGERGIYRKQDDFLALVGKARVIDRTTVVEGDSIAYQRNRGWMEAFGHVKVVDEANRSVVTGEHGTYDRRLGIAIVDSLPELRSRRGSGPATVVGSRLMVFDRTRETSTAIGDVDFRQGPTRAHADTARFHGQNLLELSGNPSVEREGRVMTGRFIRIRYVEGRLRHIDVLGSATLVDSTPDTLGRDFQGIPLANTLSGDSLSIDVVDGEIVRTFVAGSAESVYLPEDQVSVISVNEVQGDSIDIRFDDGLVDVVTVQGRVSGTYRFLERDRIRALSDSAAVELDSLYAVQSTPPPQRVKPGGIEDRPPVPAGDDSSTRVGSEPPVTDRFDSTATGTKAPAGSDARIDFSTQSESVRYEGKETVFAVPRGRIHIRGDAMVQHGTLELHARDIRFDTVERELLAEGEPRLVDKESELVGERMGYLFDVRTGAVADGATRFDDGFYYGKHIRRIDKETLLVDGGTYTTCDLADPHFHFYAKRMKLKVGQSVVARQVTFYLSDIPLVTLPFYYKKIDSGRHSGILFPNINLGVSSREGRYVRDLGYYWAVNDYTDLRFEMDYNERREATFQIENNYNVRYGFNGKARFEYLQRFSETEKGDEWKLTAQHSQPELWDVWRANARVELSSKNVTRSNLSGNSNNDLIDSRLYSTASLSRAFDNGASLNLSLARTQFPNAEDDDKIGTNNRLSEMSLPLRLSFKTRPLVSGRPRSTDGLFTRVLRDVNFSQSYSSRYDRRRNEESAEDILAATGNFSLNYAPSQRVGPFRLTSSAAFGESWQQRKFELTAYREEEVAIDDSTTTTVVVIDDASSQDLDESDSTPSLSFSNRLSTDLYGVFDTSLGPVRGFKHKISFSATHTYRPELGDKQAKSQSVGLSMGNEFSLKVRDGDALDDDGKPRTRKLDQLLTWNLATSVNPEADPGRRWSDIRSDVRVRPGITNAISFSMSQTIDPYSFEIKSTRFNSDLRLRGGFDLGGVLLERPQRKNAVIERLPAAVPDTSEAERRRLQELEDDPYAWDATDEKRLETGDRNRIPWDVYLRGSLTETRASDGSSITRSNLSARANVSLPGKWRFSWSADFDTETGEFTNQYWRLSRPLHLWRLEFSRGLADGQDFGFSLYLDTIPDLRIDRGDRARSGDLGRRLSTF